MEAYREAAQLAPERALPLASQGTVLHRLGRWPEAAGAFEQALALAPDDEATLRARGSALEARGDRAQAAADFERLAFVLDVAGRADAAAEAAGRAAALDPSPARDALVGRLVSTRDGPDREPPSADRGSATADREAPTADREPPSADESPDPVNAWPPADSPTPPAPPIVGAPPDPESLLAEAAAALDAGDAVTARERMLTAIQVHRAAGHLDAALDACLQLLAASPGDPQVHLAIANLQLDHGWTDLAREKLDLLIRLTSLTGDTQAEADAHGLAAERLRDEPAAPVGAR